MFTQILSEKKAAQKIVAHFYGHMHTDAIRYVGMLLDALITIAGHNSLNLFLTTTEEVRQRISFEKMEGVSSIFSRQL
jgi:hypothetical protein